MEARKSWKVLTDRVLHSTTVYRELMHDNLREMIV